MGAMGAMTTPFTRCLFLCNRILVLVFVAAWFVLPSLSEYSPIVVERTETGELVNLDESLIRIFLKTLDSYRGILGSFNCTAADDCEFYRVFSEDHKRGVVKRQGRCYAAIESFTGLRGLDRSIRTVCNADGICCDVNAWTANSYFTYISNMNQEWERAIEECVATCDDPEDSLILFGYSLSGPTAELAGFVLSKYKPIVVVAGSPPGFPEVCPGFNTSKYFHIQNAINFVPSNLLAVDSTMHLSGGQHLGHQIIISRQAHAVSYWGFNQPLPRRAYLTELLPFRGDDVIVTTSVCHRLYDDIYSYSLHLQRIIDRGVFPVPFGWNDTFPCMRNIDCKSGNCFEGYCAAQVVL